MSTLYVGSPGSSRLKLATTILARLASAFPERYIGFFLTKIRGIFNSRAVAVPKVVLGLFVQLSRSHSVRSMYLPLLSAAQSL